MLKARVFTALALFLAFLGALFLLPYLGWEALLALMVLAAAKEWAGLAGYSSRDTWLYLAATAALLLGAHFLLERPLRLGNYYLMVAAAAALFWLVAVPLWLKFGWQPRNRAALAVTGWLVLVPTWMAVADLRAYDPKLVLFVCMTVWIADTAAYFAGRKWGRHKLAPVISPGKSWEGAAGALVAVTACGLAFGFAVGMVTELGKWSLVVLAAILWLLTAVSILGDLFESRMKRQAGVKDSGSILPGHGGLLDRLDSLTAALPVAAVVWYLLLYWDSSRV